MCEPTTIIALAGLAVSVASAAANASNQARMAEQTDRNALAAQIDANAGLQQRMHQSDQQATDQQVERSRQAVRDLGNVTTIFADSGLSGNSQDRLSAITEGAGYQDAATIERNRASRVSQDQMEGSAISARTQSTINSAVRPSVLGTGLQIAGAGIDYYYRTHPPTSK